MENWGRILIKGVAMQNQSIQSKQTSQQDNQQTSTMCSKQQGAVIWICGLAGAGKTTIAKEIFTLLEQKYSNVIFLDGDEFREIFGRSGFSKEERLEVARLIAKLCVFLSKSGLIVVCATISLFDEIYAFNRSHITRYFEVFVECSMEELLRRDKKALYSQALKGDIKDVIGIDLTYDTPKAHYVLQNNTADKLDSKVKELYNAVEKFLIQKGAK